MNRQPYTIPPTWWAPQLRSWFVRVSRGYRRRQLRRQQIVDIRIDGQRHLQRAIESSRGVLITPNHSAHFDSNSLYVAGDMLGTPLYFMTAWQVFGMSRPWERKALQWMGCFSIDRETTDRRAYKQAVEILQRGRAPLVIFPEGDIYHVTDRVTPFREGAAAIALTAARRGGRGVAIVPCGIRFRYLEDPTPKLLDLMSRLEDRMHLRPNRGSLVERIHRLAEVLLATKEVDYLGATQAGRVRDRVRNLAEAVLHPLEQRHQTARNPGGLAELSPMPADAGPSLAAPRPARARPAVGRAIPERVKEVRQKIIAAMNACDETPPVNLDRLQELAGEMSDLFFVMQLYSYPGDYLLENPTVERIAETLDKLEEDVLLCDYPGVRGKRCVTITFGEPIGVDPGKDSGLNSTQLTQLVETNVQLLLDQVSRDTAAMAS